jgi:hypothetical protein
MDGVTVRESLGRGRFCGRGNRRFRCVVERVHGDPFVDSRRSNAMLPHTSTGARGLRGGGSRRCASRQGKGNELFPVAQVRYGIFPPIFHEQ